MKTQRSSLMYHSGAMAISLPKISKLKVKQNRHNASSQNRMSFQSNTSRANNNKSFIESSRSPFTHRVEQQALDQNQYPYIQTNNIQKQHCKLKGLLKQFNVETVTILQKYVIDKPMKRQYAKKKQPIQSLHQIRQKQAQNSTNMISILKNQIQKLQSRCQNLKYASKQQFQHKIRELKQQKQKTMMQNKEISRQITLNGLLIAKGKQSIVRELQYEHLLIDSKRHRLTKQSESVASQISSLQQKKKQISMQIEKLQQQQSYTLKQYEQIQNQKSQFRLYAEYLLKKKTLQHNKIINESTSYQLKHKYFQKLKELDQFTAVLQTTDLKIIECQLINQKAKQNIAQQQKRQNQMHKKIVASSKINTSRVNFMGKAGIKINVNLE